MEPGLEDRNNLPPLPTNPPRAGVSMESGLEDRNNVAVPARLPRAAHVSMESGLEDRNNKLLVNRAVEKGKPSQWSPT